MHYGEAVGGAGNDIFTIPIHGKEALCLELSLYEIAVIHDPF